MARRNGMHLYRQLFGLLLLSIGRVNSGQAPASTLVRCPDANDRAAAPFTPLDK